MLTTSDSVLQASSGQVEVLIPRTCRMMINVLTAVVEEAADSPAECSACCY